MTEKIPLNGSLGTAPYSQTIWNDTIGKRNYELTNHLGNVLSVISDKVIPHSNGSGGVDYFLADIRQSTDYSPFGVQLEGRNLLKTGVSKDYRRGFQGQEEDDEIKGEGNSMNYTFRMHDPRLGRFFAIDPLASEFPWNSPYAFSENKVISCVELEGLESFYAADGTKIGQVGNNTDVRVVSDADIKEVQSLIKDANHHRKEASRIQKNLIDNKYKKGKDNAVNKMWDNIANGQVADKALEGKSEAIGMKEEELFLRATMDAIQSGEGGTDENRYHRVNGGGLVSDLKEFPSESERTGGSSASGAYQILVGSWKSNSKKLGINDFSEESQDKVVIQIFKNQKVYDNIIKGNFDPVVKKLAGSGKSTVFESFQKGDPSKKIKDYIKKELNGTSLVKTKKGELIK